ncbi:mammalian cell entry protein [Mycolicibacter terrae]|uniref:Mammalian cell entry protein n=1 Tax=Mycolicibacter terrae TaxID=1788 RepID=A0AAD1HTJ4_9MYCO|nr:MCE family protein [Mycolicibacter terrae]ORW90812.1 mammalian cell entry protein [Mycolicibacter terrae]BBX21203.1 mammalian cell entry protein [Mycolicibacter terrae]SNV91169.1 MCE-family protein [Mycolicibacter terrae]
MTRSWQTPAKFGVFAAVMLLATVFLFAIFGEVRTGPTVGYSAVFNDASRLKSGDSVRVAGVRVGTVGGVALRQDGTVLVKFNADRAIPLTTGTQATVRYLNLVGDRYLELVDAPGSTRLLPAGAQIPVERTAPALDLDLLLNGLKPVIRGLNPQDVNALTASLIQIMQGQGGTIDSLMSQTSSFSNSLADNSQVIESLIDELRTVLATLTSGDKRLSGAIDRLNKLVSGLAADRDPIGTAVTALDRGTASLADLLGSARDPLTDTIHQVNRLTKAVNADQAGLDMSLQKAPENYRKAIRLGSYGGFIQYYLCAVQIRVSDTQGRTAVFPWIKSEEGRCSDNE